MGARVLMIGAGGLGCASALALSRAGRTDLEITFVDFDRVEASNLHRQVLFGPDDVGEPKAERAADAVGGRALVTRFGVANARPLVAEHDVVIEGTDRHAAKFLAADACALERVPVVHAGVVRWSGWAMATIPFETACLRCVFEDVPEGDVETCGEAGVIGPAVGVLGSLCASLALGVLDGVQGAAGQLLRYDARAANARSSAVGRRRDCALCGEVDAPIRELEERRYGPRSCAAEGERR